MSYPRRHGRLLVKCFAQEHERASRIGRDSNARPSGRASDSLTTPPGRPTTTTACDRAPAWRLTGLQVEGRLQLRGTVDAVSGGTSRRQRRPGRRTRHTETPDGPRPRPPTLQRLLATLDTLFDKRCSRSFAVKNHHLGPVS